MAENIKRLTSAKNSSSKRLKTTDKCICNYCLKEKELLAKKLFCETWSKNWVECIYCYRPLNPRLIEENSICRACSAIHKKETSLIENASTIDISSTGADDRDSLVHALASREITKTQIENKLNQYKGINWYLVMIIKMIKLNNENEKVILEVIFHRDMITTTAE